MKPHIRKVRGIWTVRECHRLVRVYAPKGPFYWFLPEPYGSIGHGYTVTNPAELDAQDAGKVMTWEQYMRRDIVALMQCDGIATLTGWSNSRGATLEIDIATRLSMPNWPVHTWLAMQAQRA